MKRPKLVEALTDACRGLDITPAEVNQALSPEDIEDWHKGELSGDTLATFANCLVQRREMDQGKRPAHYTEKATCKHCGPVWLWFSGEVLGCPWCCVWQTGRSRVRTLSGAPTASISSVLTTHTLATAPKANSKPSLDCGIQTHEIANASYQGHGKPTTAIQSLNCLRLKGEFPK